MNLTDSLFFDTDCLSAFLWVDEQSIITMLYPGRVVIPDAVYAELSHPRISHLKQRIDTLLNEHLLQIQSIIVGTPVYGLYQKLAMNPDAGMAVIGKGEASAIALAKESGGILASNNLKDVLQYVRLFSLRHVTTGDILKEALASGLISMSQGEQIWQDMLNKRRKLGANSFKEFLALADV